MDLISFNNKIDKLVELKQHYNANYVANLGECFIGDCFNVAYAISYYSYDFIEKLNCFELEDYHTEILETYETIMYLLNSCDSEIVKAEYVSSMWEGYKIVEYVEREEE